MSKRRPLPLAVSPTWRDQGPPVERPAPTVDQLSDAVRACDRPGLEGGVNFWDYWREHRDPGWGMYGDDGL